MQYTAMVPPDVAKDTMLVPVAKYTMLVPVVHKPVIVYGSVYWLHL